MKDTPISDNAIGGTLRYRVIIAEDLRSRKATYNRVLKSLQEDYERQEIEFRYSGSGGYFFDIFETRSGMKYRLLVWSSYSANLVYNFSYKFRGSNLDEVITTAGCYDDVAGNPTMMSIILSSLKGCKDSSMFRRVNDGRFHQLPYNEGASWVEHFNFPASLYRSGMEQYFEIPDKPTEDEFLLAITAEGLNGNSKKEVAAIEEAKIHVLG